MTNASNDELMDFDANFSDDLDARFCAPQPGDEALIARVQARVMAAVQALPPAPHRTVRPSSPGWEVLAPGIERKILWESGGARSCMVRLAAGATYPMHVHGMDEECVVLEGSLTIGDDIELHEGDFHVGRRGCAHGETVTRTGALIYLRGAAAEL